MVKAGSHSQPAKGAVFPNGSLVSFGAGFGVKQPRTSHKKPGKRHVVAAKATEAIQAQTKTCMFLNFHQVALEKTTQNGVASPSGKRVGPKPIAEFSFFGTQACSASEPSSAT